MRTQRIFESVFFRLRIEMLSRGLECWAFTLGKLMKVDRMRARREVFQIQLHPDAFSRGRKSRRTNGFTLRILQLHSVSGMLRRNKRQQTADNDSRDYPRDKVFPHS